MTVERIDPIAVLDPEEIPELAAGEHEARLVWLRSQGIEPNDARRVEIFRIDRADTAFYAHVSAVLRDANGHRYCVRGHDHLSADVCRLAMCSYVMLLSALPPKETGLDLYKERAL